MKNKFSKKVMMEFLDLKAPTYQNKNNGQISIVLPKKELMKMMHNEKDSNMYLPKTLPIRIFKWRKK